MAAFSSSMFLLSFDGGLLCGLDLNSPRSVTKWYSTCWHDLASKQLTSFSRHSKMTLEFVDLENTVVSYFRSTCKLDLNFFAYYNYAENISSYSSSLRVVEKLQQKKHRVRYFHIFPCFTLCIFGRNLERDGQGRAGSTNQKISFH